MFLGMKHTSLMILLWLSESFVYYEYSAGQIYQVIWEILGYIPITYERDVFSFLCKQSTCNASKYECSECRDKGIPDGRNSLYTVLTKLKGSFEQEKISNIQCIFTTIYEGIKLSSATNMHKKFLGLKQASQMLLLW